MSLEQVKQYFDSLGLGQRVHELAQSSATVEEAAVAVGCEPERIAKTMSFLLGEEPILIVTAGDARIDNKKYKEHFHQKAKMIPGGGTICRTRARGSLPFCCSGENSCILGCFAQTL